MNIAKYVACICEGSAEEVIINILLDNDLLIINREQLLEEKPIRERKGSAFEKKYLRKEFDGTITVFRILDSRSEAFKISKAYQHKVDIINVITAPEIEMLIIFNENAYNEYKKSGKKPSAFCKENLKMKHVKETSFVREYFSDASILINAITKYHSKAKVKNGEYTLLDLLK